MQRVSPPSFRTLEEMMVATAVAVRPPERLSVSSAAAKYRYLDNPGSYVGPWRNEKTPYLVEPMDEMTSMQFTGLAFAGPARTGKSDMFFNWLTHSARCDPADMMFVAMTQTVARDWSIGDLDKAKRHTKAIGEAMVPGRQNDNVHDKRFKSGMRLLIKWPVITELSGKTLPRVWFADYDRMEDDIAKEGPPFDLGRKRTQTYKRFGMTVAESSPGREVTDPKHIPNTPHEAPPTTGILALYNRGDRRRYYSRCLSCRVATEFDFQHFNYPDSSDFMEAAEMVTLRCPHCGFDHEPSMKTELFEHLKNSRWIKDGMHWDDNGSIIGKPMRTDIASFWLKGPPAAFQTWESIVYNYLIANREYEMTGDEGALKKTTNTDQGHPYTPKAIQSNRLPDELKNRAENWGGSKDEPVVPEGVRFLQYTIDVQAGSRSAFVVHVYGIGVGGDIWHVDMFKIRKSERLDASGERELIDPAAYEEDWRVLIPQVILKTYPLADGSGRRMAMKMGGCDLGGADGVTANAYNFWRYLRDGPPKDSPERKDWIEGLEKRFQLVKGEPSKSAPRVRLGYPDSQRKDRHAGSRGDVPVLFINSNSVKDMVASMLGRSDAPAGLVTKFGQVHYPHWAENWLYTQLTSEFRTDKGWEKPGKKRNEAFDLLYYCVAIAIHAPIRLEQMDWQKPPAWADEWDKNELVFGEHDQPPFQKPKTKKFDLAALAQRLA
ncbi:MAG: hypothetical protein E5X45_27480 [Mesorhizobium sp.]|nr:MAG: hypothetical protein E5X45_27480 [Mesorhizobium sp.]